MVFEYQDFRTFLKEEFVSRQKKNSSYSQRAFARDLGLEISHLSYLLQGKKSVSKEKAIEMAGKLGLDSQKTEYFLLLLEKDTSALPSHKEFVVNRMNALNPSRDIHDLSVDLFRAISEWYHIPIIEMTRLSGPPLTAELASKRLGISKIEAELAIDRLKRLELLEEKNGSLVPIVDNYLFNSATPNQSFRAFHRSMIERAVASIEEQDPKERYLGSETYAVDPEDYNEVITVLNDARQRVEKIVGKKKKIKSELYQLCIQFFKLTNHKEKMK